MTEQIRGGGQPTWPLSPYQIRVSYGATATANAPAGTIARGTGADWFGPLDPLRPIAPPEVAGRRFDFPSGYNLVTRPRAYEPIGFAELRAFADAYDLLRLVIETRKDQMERQRWRIRARQFVSAPAQRARGSAQSAAEGARSATPGGDTSARIAAVQNFFQKPDGVTRWKTWLRALLEDMFVIDAATLYCQRTRSGRLCALQQLDGATIKRVIDDWGRTPLPYADAGGATIYPPAYQQVLKGLPAVNYSAHDIIYRPRNVRAHRVYGYSPVQQVLMTVNIALRRQLWQLDYFSEGSIPDALIGVPQNWTPDQIKQFQDYWDTEFAGDLARRRRAKFVPGEAAAKVVQTKEPSHKDDFDEWLARIICYAFSVPPQWATKVMNRATADNQSAQAEDEGLEPTKEWVKDLVDEIIAEELSSPDLELAWLDEDEADPKGLEAVLEGRVKLGAVTLKRIEICGKVVDDAEWQKVAEGVYTGFSQGGRYLRRWPDPDQPKLTRYTAEPVEVSLVDHPCLPEATFAVIKADGSSELRAFKAGAGEAFPHTSLRAQRSNPGVSTPESALLRRFAPRNDDSGDLGKVGARHSKADKERIKQSHDLLVALDPDCCPGGHVPGANVDPRPRFSPQAGEHGDAYDGGGETEKLAKSLERSLHQTLVKALGGLQTRLDEFAARLKKIEDQPLPLGTSSVRVVGKSEDALAAEPASLLDRPGALEALADAAIRKAQSQPMRAIPGFGPRQS